MGMTSRQIHLVLIQVIATSPCALSEVSVTKCSQRLCPLLTLIFHNVYKPFRRH